MGVWGPGITSNDTAEDVIDICKAIYPFLPPKKANQKILEEFRDILSLGESDDDVADFWYSLTNWQWNHGVLTEENKTKVLRMLENNYGMALWHEAGDKQNIKKRTKALQELYTKLSSPQPPMKIPRVTLKKPKHRVGDVILLQPTRAGLSSEDHIWIVDDAGVPGEYFANKGNFPRIIASPVLDANNKFLAILCVGTEKEPYSPYLPDLYEEHSVYAFYDYCQEEKPTLETLKQCGFLPTVDVDYSDFNYGITSEIYWTYTFVTIDPFRPSQSDIASIEKLHSLQEANRFHSLMSQKNYCNTSIGCYTLWQAFETFNWEKMQFLSVGIQVDTLLEQNTYNPELLSPQSYNKLKKR